MQMAVSINILYEGMVKSSFLTDYFPLEILQPYPKVNVCNSYPFSCFLGDIIALYLVSISQKSLDI